MVSTTRYNRQIILKGFGEAAQNRLKAAKVLVIGAGGLGCPALLYLTAAGIGKIGLVDDDQIELSNLQRQVLYADQNIGESKVDVALKRLSEMNPDINLIGYGERLRQSNIIDIINGYDYVLDGTDNFESKYLINDCCALLGKPLIFAAVSGFEGQLAVFNCGEQSLTTNYRDIFPTPPVKGEVPNCAENGIIGVLPGILGTMAAAEIIKLISQVGKPLINKLLLYDMLSASQYVLQINPGRDYEKIKTMQQFLDEKYEGPIIGKWGLIEIDAEKLFTFLESPSTIVIDIRESEELPRLDEKIYTCVPLSGFETFIKGHIEAENIVLLCQSGIRCKAAAAIITDEYGLKKKIYSLKGGILNWINFF